MDIRHDLTGSSFVMLNDDGTEEGRIVYDVESDGNLSALSVRVSPELQGQGAAGKLLDALVEYARKHSLKIFPVCPYVVKKFDQGPDVYGDVINTPPNRK